MLFLRWNVADMLGTYSIMFPQTHNMQPQATAKEDGRWSRVEPWPGSVGIHAGNGTGWHFAADKLHSICQAGEIGEDVFLSNQQI